MGYQEWGSGLVSFMTSPDFLDLLELHLEDLGFFTRRLDSPVFTDGLEPVVLLQVSYCAFPELSEKEVSDLYAHNMSPHSPPDKWVNWNYPAVFNCGSDVYFMPGRDYLFAEFKTLMFCKVEDPHCLRRVVHKLREARYPCGF